jgi:MFS family permease
MLLTGTQIIFVMLGTLGPGFADQVLSIDVRDASLLIVGPAVLGILVGTILVGNFGVRFRRRDLIKAGIVAAGITLLLISFVVRIRGFVAVAVYFPPEVRLTVSFILFFLLGFANSLLDVPANSLLQEEATGSMRGRVYGMLTTAVGGAGMLPVIAGGILADVVGVGRVIFLLGLVILIYGLVRIKYNHTKG